MVELSGPPQMMSFVEADGFIWMTNDTGRRSTENVKSKVTAEPDNESATLVPRILEIKEFPEGDCLFSVEQESKRPGGLLPVDAPLELPPCPLS